MHMSDALISPAVGGIFWATSATAVLHSSRKARTGAREGAVPLMGLLGAFVFTAQMINFAIPGTGSSGHLGGGILLAMLLGPHAAVLVMTSILGVQALFFADGGLLALGCNIFNLAVLPAYVAYPLVCRPLLRYRTVAIPLACLVGLQLGSFSVVLQTTASGFTALPFRPFLFAMLPIHLAIGLVEGFATVALVSFLDRHRPDLLPSTERSKSRKRLWALAGATLVVGGWLSWYASEHPDGLEWAIKRVTGHQEVTRDTRTHQTLAQVQQKVAVMPDYAPKNQPARPAHTSMAGLLGAAATLVLAGSLAWVLRRRTT